MLSRKLVAAAVAVAALAVPGVASASDVVVDWNRALVDTLYASRAAPNPASRTGAIVQTAVFDAVNGITRRYTQYRPDLLPAAPHGASPAAAAVSAAYTSLVALIPSQKAALDAQYASSLAEVSHGNSRAVDRGLAWGAAVANAIVAWRSTDGFTAVLPNYVPGTQPGDWQPQPGIVNPVFRQWATMTPWTMTSPSQFRPAARPSLSDPTYLADLAQVAALGNAATVTPANLTTARFWQGTFTNVVTMWNGAAEPLVAGQSSLTDEARTLALLNLAIADASIAVWEAKNAFNFWRPITAIHVFDPTWKPAIPTPNHQEFPSGHSGLSSAAAGVLEATFGADATYTITSDAVPAPGNARTFTGFDTMLEEIALARVYGGIHFLHSCFASQTMGLAIAEQALETQLLPLHDDGDGDDD